MIPALYPGLIIQKPAYQIKKPYWTKVLSDKITLHECTVWDSTSKNPGGGYDHIGFIEYTKKKKNCIRARWKPLYLHGLSRVLSHYVDDFADESKPRYKTYEQYDTDTQKFDVKTRSWEEYVEARLSYEYSWINSNQEHKMMHGGEA
jgi:hypothetical protein